MLRAYFASRRRLRLRASVSAEGARARAARGATLLDDRDPGWAARIDARTLELGDGAACVLGQLHGDYRLGLTRSRAIDASSAPGRFVSPIDLGFQAVSEAGPETERLDYAFLTRAWRGEIRSRRPQVAATGTASSSGSASAPGSTETRRTDVPQRLQ